MWYKTGVMDALTERNTNYYMKIRENEQENRNYRSYAG